ncbi:uncharacterized protein [Panulirus ornatus]|uniref:uncharacterized protein n=1 Tax=Panulirus ornatus TaxID=150431 RepID=UPI003A8412C4
MALSDIVSVVEDRNMHRFKGPPLLQLLLLKLLLVVSAVAELSLPEVCRIPYNTAVLNTSGTVFFHTNVKTLRIVMRNPKCGSLVASNVNLDEIVARNLTSGEGDQVNPWYELNFISNNEEHLVKIGSRTIERFEKEPSPLACDMNEIKFFFERSTILGRSCMELNDTLPVDKPLNISLFGFNLVPASHNNQQPRPSDKGTHPFPFSNDQNDSTIIAFSGIEDTITGYRNYPKVNSDFVNDQPSWVKRFRNDDNQDYGSWQDTSDTFSHSIFAIPTYPPPITEDSRSLDPSYGYRNDRESVIPIFIGVIAFVVSMCIRFCLCRRKRVVTTVTVIRSIPSPEVEANEAPSRHQDHLDLPPAYADILNETSSAQDCPPDSYMDLPPAYDDIRDESAPPPYSEIEAQSPDGSERATPYQPSTTLGDIATPGEPIPQEETADGDGNTEPVGPCPPGPDSAEAGIGSSSLTRVLTSQFRSLRTQFAFKPLQEE